MIRCKYEQQNKPKTGGKIKSMTWTGRWSGKPNFILLYFFPLQVNPILCNFYFKNSFIVTSFCGALKEEEFEPHKNPWN